MLLFLHALSVYPVYRISLKEAQGASSNVHRLVLFISVSILLASWTGFMTRYTAAPSGLPADPPVSFMVIKASERRYDRELLLEARPGAAVILALATAPLEADIVEGDRITIKARVSRIAGQNGYERSLLRKGIAYRAYLDDGNWSLERRYGAPVARIIRDSIEGSLRALFSETTATLVSALYFGNDDRLDRGILLDFKRAGILHILAASGFNVGLLAFIPLTLLGLLRVNRKIIAAVCGITVLAYFLITDMPVSLFRAVIMAVLYSLFFIGDASRNIFNILFLSALLIVLVHPYELYNPGFQLSFGATLGILLFYARFRDALRRIPGPLGASLALTFAAQLPVMPIIALHMEEFNAIGIVSNVVMIPLISCLVYASLGAIGILPLLPHAASALAAATEILCRLALAAAGFLASQDLHFHATARHPAVVIAALLAGAALIPRLRKNGAAIALLTLSAILPAFLLSTAPGGETAVFRKGGSVALLVRDGERQALMGTIGDMATAREIVRAVSMDPGAGLTLILPRPDYKTVQACAFIARNVPVKGCIMAQDFTFSRSFKQLLSIFDRDRVKIEIRPFAGDGKNFVKNDNFTLDSQMKLVQLYNKYTYSGLTTP